ncbi:MAG TPA: YbhB/YbcL family Raf kinase inhibitor-like protein [Planctomycetota bacterium]|nr:YbhB/YbcL family Raf kinase inhibitor-like protein [Planctomycetota bacterium]
MTSPSFSHGGPLPARCALHGGNCSPALSWAEPPRGTVSLALTFEDLHGTSEKPFTLWILYNIPASRHGIPEGLSKRAFPSQVPGAEQGANDTGEVGYDGPAPPRGHPDHHYTFHVHALDIVLALPPGATRAEFDDAIAGHGIGSGALSGTYHR